MERIGQVRGVSRPRPAPGSSTDVPPSSANPPTRPSPKYFIRDDMRFGELGNLLLFDETRSAVGSAAVHAFCLALHICLGVSAQWPNVLVHAEEILRIVLCL